MCPTYQSICAIGSETMVHCMVTNITKNKKQKKKGKEKQTNMEFINITFTHTHTHTNTARLQMSVYIFKALDWKYRRTYLWPWVLELEKGFFYNTHKKAKIQMKSICNSDYIKI